MGRATENLAEALGPSIGGLLNATFGNAADLLSPVLVLASVLMGVPLDLHFSIMEVRAVVIAIGIMSMVSQDGETNWLEGAMLLAVYAMLGLAFYHLPPESVPAAR